METINKCLKNALFVMTHVRRAAALMSALPFFGGVYLSHRYQNAGITQIRSTIYHIPVLMALPPLKRLWMHI